METHGSVATGSKDDSNLGRRVNVVARNQASGGVVDERDELDGHLDPLERLAEHGRAVLALRVGVAEALGPSDEHTVVDLVLRARVRELMRRRVEESDFIERATLEDKNERARTVKPSAKSDLSPSLRPSWSLKKLLTHSAQKSKSFAPSCCFCSSVSLYLDCLTSNLPPPRRVTRQTRRFVPPKSTAMKSPVSLPEGYCTKTTKQRVNKDHLGVAAQKGRTYAEDVGGDCVTKGSSKGWVSLRSTAPPPRPGSRGKFTTHAWAVSIGHGYDKRRQKQKGRCQ